MKNRAYVYIDGFNLYHGLLKRTPYKWLDLVAFSNRLLPTYNVLMVKYFTAPCLPFEDPSRPFRQQVYWNALNKYNPGNYERIDGQFRIDPKALRLAYEYPRDRWNSSFTSVMVMKPEVKGTDVNLAAHPLNDGWLYIYDAALVISNDSDLYESVKMVKCNLGRNVILANPVKHHRPKVAAKFNDLHLEKRNIKIAQIRDCQLPDPIPGTNIRKPGEW